MKKTKGITKYEPHWQFLRVAVKGNNDELRKKLDLVWDYFQQNKTQDRYERVVNWIEGLVMGFKSSRAYEKIEICNTEILRYGNREDLSIEGWNLEEWKDECLEIMKGYSFKERLATWMNNFTRAQAYLLGGYYHKELNLFLDLLYSTFSTEERNKIRENYSLKRLEEYRVQQPNVEEKTVRFFF